MKRDQLSSKSNKSFYLDQGIKLEIKLFGIVWIFCFLLNKDVWLVVEVPTHRREGERAIDRDAGASRKKSAQIYLFLT